MTAQSGALTLTAVSRQSPPHGVPHDPSLVSTLRPLVEPRHHDLPGSREGDQEVRARYPRSCGSQRKDSADGVAGNTHGADRTSTLLVPPILMILRDYGISVPETLPIAAGRSQTG